MDWIDDPSNLDETYDRVRIRKALTALEPLGLSVPSLAQVAQQLGDARDALAQVTHDLARNIATVVAGDILLDRDAFGPHPPDIRRRLMVAALKWVSGAEYGPRRKPMLDLLDRLDDGRDSTLHGCRILVERKHFRICRELAAIRDEACQPAEIWDKKWVLTGPGMRGPVHIRALTDDGLNTCPDWRALGRPRAALIATPAVWRGDQLIAAPMAGFTNGWQAKLTPQVADFHSFILSR